MKTVCAFVFLLLSLVLNGQTYFNNRYDFDSIFDGATNIIEMEDSYLLVGMVGEVATWDIKTGIYIIDNQGLEKKKWGMVFSVLIIMQVFQEHYNKWAVITIYQAACLIQ